MQRAGLDRWLTWLVVPATMALMTSALTFSRHAYTGVSVQGDRVATVAPGGPADRAGLRPGDVLSPGPGQPALSPLDPNPLRTAEPDVPLLVRRARGRDAEVVWLAPEPLPAEIGRAHV